MSAKEKQALAELCVDHDTNEVDTTSESFTHEYNIGDVLDGSEPLEISHGGGEFNELTRQLLGDFYNLRDPLKSRAHRTDYRTRRDRAQRRVDAFNYQLNALTHAYLEWSLAHAENGIRGFFDSSPANINTGAHGTDSGHTTVRIVDIFCAGDATLSILTTDSFIASALVRQGVIPCSPITPNVAITIGALELYRVARQRNPHFSIQAFVKTLCDLQGVQFQRYLSRQFSIALDLYLQLRANVDSLVQETLLRDSPDWRLKHACPACTYELKGESKLTFKLLYAMDGNDSLKRVVRRLSSEDDGDSETPPSSELTTTQRVAGDRYISRDFVDKFAKDAPGDIMDDSNDRDNPCAGRWKNMKDDQTKKMWGVFDESGVFVAVCRHGFCLVIADMVRSGELAKYPLAVVSKLVDSFGDGLGGGYDIGCRFKTTLNNSSLGPIVRERNHTCLVPAFHGHAHRRLCQLFHLAVYIPGLGLEDLETCERTFSKSNALAASVRYASAFHRQQAISLYFEHNDDFEVYANLTTFLYNNYKQALDILNDGSLSLPRAMQKLNISSTDTFNQWLEEEKTYLLGLQYEPIEETLQMEYWQKLVNLTAHKAELDDAMDTWDIVSAPTTYSQDVATTAKREATRRHAIERYDASVKIVQDLEKRLGITHRWTPEDPEWQSAGKLVANRKYQRALDTLEALIVSRLFELSKMNRAGTGYKLRKHIGKALQVRSAAIRTALDRYNTAAQALMPPRPQLKLDEVVEFTFLADFDLLRESRQDVSTRPWATPAARLAMDSYFKMCRAREEIERLNIEVQRVSTYLQDEDRYLRTCEDQLRESHPALAHQVSMRRKIRSRFTTHHLQRLKDIAALPGFSGTIAPGISNRNEQGDSASIEQVRIPAQLTLTPTALSLPNQTPNADTQDDLEEEEEDEEAAEECSRELQDLWQASGDPC
ncbi:hypothetical protein BJ138DRAFT_1138426 [Hygrophoropsis aurantiaca]|uniref:Uncharacterized protein n=1 Tax=Hygrophoropsis aurantiaca TaxID=72124 RepID=A0ACB7ZUQ0_9AGAM|nr:hypothetical protein BJ138DRAFT_1138426 [Hygrophoropsis aurantiaca]